MAIEGDSMESKTVAAATPIRELNRETTQNRCLTFASLSSFRRFVYFNFIVISVVMFERFFSALASRRAKGTVENAKNIFFYFLSIARRLRWGTDGPNTNSNLQIPIYASRRMNRSTRNERWTWSKYNSLARINIKSMKNGAEIISARWLNMAIGREVLARAPNRFNVAVNSGVRSLTRNTGEAQQIVFSRIRHSLFAAHFPLIEHQNENNISRHERQQKNSFVLVIVLLNDFSQRNPHPMCWAIFYRRFASDSLSF